jgi:hypothetical protein
MLSKALEMGVCFHSVPAFCNMEGRSFPRVCEGMEKILYLRKML